MDARQKFYNHNRLLFRFLVSATIIFVAIVGLLSWQEAHRIRPVSDSVSSLRHFSAEAAMAEATRNYAYEAKHIHDLEAYSDLVSIFFSPQLNVELGETTLGERLDEVAKAEADQTEFGNAHVYHTSYYVGNALVLPELSLHELLTTAALPNTAILLETALADLRAGAVKIQNHYDVAPPTWYRSTSSLLFYPTPSFPSLTMSETALVWYLLATLDPEHARYYERQAKIFASQLFTSGAHFRLDIEYAILLANQYAKIIKEVPAYQELLAKASQEWPSAKVIIGEVELGEIPYEFTFPDFPIPSQFSVKIDKASAYVTPSQEEELRGSLRLTLIDTRLPEPTFKLYEYNFSGPNQVLPFALDLTSRQFPGLMSSVGYAQYLDSENYLFLSGVTENDSRGKYFLSSTSVYWRNSKVTPVIFNPVPQGSYGVSQVVLRNTGDEFLFVPIRYASNLPSIMRAELDSSYAANVTEVGKEVFSHNYIGEDAVAYLKDGWVYYTDLKTGKENTLSGLSARTEIPGPYSDLKYYKELKKLILTTHSYIGGTKVMENSINLYEITEANGELEATINAVVTVTDARVIDIMLSPGGQYLAITLTKGGTGHTPELLLYDIKSGIISKEIDLSPFAPSVLELDGWTLF